MPEPLVILGAGAAGLGAAYAAGGQVPVHEQAADAGGLCRSMRVGAYRFDETAHVLYFHDETIRRLVQELLGDNLQAYDRRARVYAHGRYLRYPFQAHLHGLPEGIIRDCLRGRRQADTRRDADRSPSSFDGWVRQRLGQGVARHFMTPYNTKFWTLPPTELTPEWAERFVPVPTLEQMRRGAQTDDPMEYGYNVRFVYPRQGGVASLMAALANQAAALQFNKRVARIDLTRRLIWFADGTDVAFERAISTIPLPELRRVLAPLPDAVSAAFDRLRWLSLFVLHLGVRDDAIPAFDWAYFPEPDVPFFRVGCPSRYAPDSAPAGCRTLSAEVSFSSWKPLPDQAQLIHDIIDALMRVGLLSSPASMEAQTIARITYGYPIYDHAYRDATDTILAFLRHHGIVPAGRFGRWAYLSLEDSLIDGMRAAQACRERASACVPA
ncbi:MAG: FAD-dependent oxidoreductase [Candidatus Omnitrophica bacterium]|nr:FAD-dependent oxidoreductase [Candidatus Omnitrophota bacterium]